MTSPRLAYDDAATTSEMVTDAAAVGRELRLSPRPGGLAGRHRLQAAPFTTPVVSAELAELASGLELHFD